jgi:hypothetical protein
MKKAIRLMLPSALLACTVGAHAEALFTFNIPVDVHDIPAAYTSIKIGCAIRGVSPLTFQPEGAANMLAYATIPLVGGKAKTTISVTFDKKDLRPNYQANPAGVTEGECNFSFQIPGENSVSYEAGHGQAAIKPGTPFLNRASVNFAAMRGKN